jgi:predicted amidohydrolase
MTRTLTFGAAQLGPIARADSRDTVVARLLEMMREAHGRGCDVIVYPELALTTFFPRWFFEDQDEIDTYFERVFPSPVTQPLFDEAKRLGMGFHIGYAELVEQGDQTRRFNTAVVVDKSGNIALKYRKIHLPGHAEHEPYRAFQHLEKRYFEVGDLGFPVVSSMDGNLGICICNDRRWPEAYRVMGLQDVEAIFIGYNTPTHNPPAPQHDHLTSFHNHLSMQSGAYQNATWVVGAAKAGREEGVDMLGQSVIISPSGEIVAMASTLEDELITAKCDLDFCSSYKETWFAFEKHRRPEHYGLIVERTGAKPPGSTS